jgi:fructose-bisphosphate aldolase/6-deoxy-5-ketofructose 1-phosphate synthase
MGYNNYVNYLNFLIMLKINVPADVPQTKIKEYRKNYKTVTQNTGNLMLFPGDQKVEHLNDDFFGPKIHPDVADPEHLFKIASLAKIGVFGTQIGLISQYGRDYPQIPYLVKTNAKSNLIKKDIDDPMSNAWLDIEQIIKFKKQSKLNIVAVGYTMYLGSKYESIMLRQVAQLIFKAHQEGLIFLLWMYPRGKAVVKEKNVHLIAGGAGVAACLGADFVKVIYPRTKNKKKDAENFREVVLAAGRTGVICSGGSKIGVKEFLENIYLQKNISGTRGNAVARNIYQRPLAEAIKMANAVSAISAFNYSVEDAYDIYLGKKKLK